MEVGSKKSAKGMKLAPSLSSSSSSCFITDLPTPILMEIFCRLPIETLTVSKSVCKSWLHLSRDPYFTQLHQTRAPTEVCFQVLHDEDTLKLHMGNFHSLTLDVKLNTLFEIPKFIVKANNALYFGAGTGYFKFSNSCNGLLCYHTGFFDRFAVVWNPCTSEFITLPASATWKCCHYGLGFSKKTNKYKLLRVVSQRIGDSLCRDIVAEICTIEKGCSWNTLGPCPSYVWNVIHYCSSYEDPTFLHGKLHWLDARDDILTFDFEDEQFERVPLPSSVGKKRTCEICEVGELSGCLFITEYTGKGINIWLMKEYSVQDSWTKMYSLPCTVKGERINEYCFLPITCTNNGELLLAHNKEISTSVFSYNPDLEGFRRIGSGRGHLRVIPYRPSLVLLKDSMLGYEVHVTALKHRVMSKTPDWWTPSAEKGRKADK